MVSGSDMDCLPASVTKPALIACAENSSSTPASAQRFFTMSHGRRRQGLAQMPALADAAEEGAFPDAAHSQPLLHGQRCAAHEWLHVFGTFGAALVRLGVREHIDIGHCRGLR